MRKAHEEPEGSFHLIWDGSERGGGIAPAAERGESK